MKITKQKAVELGIFVSYLLRHGAKSENIHIDSNGWVSTADVINASVKAYHQCDLDIIKHIVENNSKKRYELSNDHNYIRALQGHSEKDVTIEFLEKIPPKTLFHGTSTDNLEFIKNDGIKKMSRLYVHLSEDFNTAKKVGIRHAKENDKLIILEVRALDMMNDGIKFYLSDNNVWLTDCVDFKYIKNKI